MVLGVCRLREKKFRLPGNGKRRTLTSGDYRGPTRAGVRPWGRCWTEQRMMPKWYTRVQVHSLAHEKNRCTLYFSRHTHTHTHTRVPAYAEKANAHAMVLHLAVLYLTTHALHRRKEGREERKRERERESLRMVPPTPSFASSTFFSFSPLSTFTSFISCVPRSRDVSTEYRPQRDTFSIVSVHRLLVDSDTHSGVRLASRFCCSLLSTPSAASELNFSAVTPRIHVSTTWLTSNDVQSGLIGRSNWVFLPEKGQPWTASTSWSIVLLGRHRSRYCGRTTGRRHKTRHAVYLFFSV